MKSTIFDYQSYKPYLDEWLKNQEKQGRGLRSALAAEMKCQSAYVSQVLRGLANFSLEQAEVANRFMKHTEEESEFFYLLVQLERAGSENLKNYFIQCIEKIKSKRRVLSERLNISEGLSELDRARYYSAWWYTATHILLTIPGFQNRSSLAKRLGIENLKMAEILNFLVQAGLVTQNGDQYAVTNARIHLSNFSPEILKHHSN